MSGNGKRERTKQAKECNHTCPNCCPPNPYLNETDEEYKARTKKMDADDAKIREYEANHLKRHPHGTPKHRITPMCDVCWETW